MPIFLPLRQIVVVLVVVVYEVVTVITPVVASSFSASRFFASRYTCCLLVDEASTETCAIGPAFPAVALAPKTVTLAFVPFTGTAPAPNNGYTGCPALVAIGLGAFWNGVTCNACPPIVSVTFICNGTTGAFAAPLLHPARAAKASDATRSDRYVPGNVIALIALELIV